MDFSLITSILTTTVPILGVIFGIGYKVSEAERKIYRKIDTHNDELDDRFDKLEKQFLVLIQGESHLQEIIQLKIDKDVQQLESSLQSLQREIGYINGELEEIKLFLSKQTGFKIRGRNPESKTDSKSIKRRHNGEN